MALTKFIIPPEATGYSMEDPNEVIAIKLDGGASRYRRDKVGGTSRVTVKWSFDRDEYHYFRAFYRSLLGRGAQPFLIDLVIDLADPTEHTAYFVPGTVRLQEQRGHYYGVTAELEAYQTPLDETEELNFAALFSEFGATYATDFPPLEDVLNEVVNVQLPGAL
jgi:hypothetical protein